MRYISMEREHLRLLFKDDLSQIMLIIMLINSYIINELGQISVKNKVYLIFVCTQIFQKVFLCMNIRYDMFTLSKTEEVLKYNCSLRIHDHFFAIFESKFWPKI